MTDAFKNTLAWLLIGTIGLFMAMNWAGASFDGMEYLPAGNDSFYHARRILDTWSNPSAFYEFDPKIHVPQGSWITWPWLYDYLLARVLRILVPVSTGHSPMPVLVYLPALWTYVNIGLVLAISATLKLPRSLQMLAGLCAALLPLNQFLHSVGRIDHHFMTYTFVLLTLLTSLRWLSEPNSRGRAAMLGCTLGVACGVHNALFILQIPVLFSLFILWVRREAPAANAAGYFATFLLLGTGLIVFPSQPFLNGEFVYYLLSSFHLYIAFCTSIVSLVMCVGEFSARRVSIIVALGLLMLLPIVGQVQLTADFFAQRIPRLTQIGEMRSMLTIAASKGGFNEIVANYSFLAFAIPAIFLGLIVWLFRVRDRAMTLFIVFSLFGLFLMAVQFRFHSFGSFALYLPILISVNKLLLHFERRRPAILAATVVVFFAAFYKPVQAHWFAPLSPGFDSHYQAVGSLMPLLSELCQDRPGTVFAWPDVGHFVRFHTECSVIANNFLLTPQHAEKARELDRAMAQSVEEFLLARPDVTYILAHYPSFIAITDNQTERLLGADELRIANRERPLFVELLGTADPQKAFPRLEFQRQVVLTLGGRSAVVARLFVVRDTGTSDRAPHDALQTATAIEAVHGGGVVAPDSN